MALLFGYSVLNDDKIDIYIDSLIGASESKSLKVNFDDYELVHEDEINLTTEEKDISYLTFQEEKLEKLFELLLKEFNVETSEKIEEEFNVETSEKNEEGIDKYLYDLYHRKKQRFKDFFDKRRKRLEQIRNFKPRNCINNNKLLVSKKFAAFENFFDNKTDLCDDNIFDNEPYSLQSKKIRDLLNEKKLNLRPSNVRISKKDFNEVNWIKWKNMYYRLYLIDGILFEIEKFVKNITTEFTNIFVDIFKPIKSTVFGNNTFITKKIKIKLDKYKVYRFNIQDQTKLVDIPIDSIYTNLTEFFTAMKNDDNTKLTKIFTAIKNDDAESQHGGGPFSFLKKVVDIFYCGVKFFVSRALKLIVGTIGVAIGSIIGAFYITGLSLLSYGFVVTFDISGLTIGLMATSITIVLLDQTILRAFTEKNVPPIFTHLIYNMIIGSTKYAFTGGGNDNNMEDHLYTILLIFLFSNDINKLLDDKTFKQMCTGTANINNDNLLDINKLVTDITVDFTKYPANLKILLDWLKPSETESEKESEKESIKQNLYDKFKPLLSETHTFFEKIKNNFKDTIALLTTIFDVLVHVPGLKNKILIMHYCLLQPQYVIFVKNMLKLETFKFPEVSEKEPQNLIKSINSALSSVRQITKEQAANIIKYLESSPQQGGNKKKNYVILKKTKVKRRVYHDSNKKRYIKLKSQIVYLDTLRGKYLKA